MLWTVIFHPDFEPEFELLPEAVQDKLLQASGLLKQLGPNLGRPHVDTLLGSAHRNMKEIRFDAAEGAWRVAFAFDPVRQAVVLVAGDKSGVSQRRFYKRLIANADERFADHVKRLLQ